MQLRRSDHDKGFSLVELMTVVGIIGLLVTIAVASFSVSVERSRRVRCISNQRLFDSALMQYQIEHNGSWPADLDEARPYVRWVGASYATCASDPAVHFTYDPATGAVECPNHPR